jgi:hypothetical protein
VVLRVECVTPVVAVFRIRSVTNLVAVFVLQRSLQVANNVITYQLERAFEMVAQEKQIQQMLEMLSQLVYLLERVPII